MLKQDNRDCVVCIHGIWMNGLDMTLLRRRLRRGGFQTRQFSYRSIFRDIEQNALRLNRFLQGIDSPVVHFVAHSLGGLVLMRLFLDHPRQRPGRIVTLGTPHIGSEVGRVLAGYPVLRVLLGKSVRGDELTGNGLPLPPDRQIGAIAGDINLGIGAWVPGLPYPRDGTVAVAETRHPDLSAHLVRHVSHMGLLFSPEVARQIRHYLRYGCFDESSETHRLRHK